MKNATLIGTIVGIGFAGGLLAAETRVETLTLDADREICVEAGDTYHIEYLSGTAAATLTKTGGGTLEVAVLANANAAIKVAEGTLKSVTPAFPAIDTTMFFHLDAADATSYETVTENGTNFISKVTFGTVSATPVATRQKPFLRAAALNGHDVLDFGPLYSSVQKVGGATLTLSEQAHANEYLYVFMDDPDAQDVPGKDGADIIGPNPLNLRYTYRGYGGNGKAYPFYYTAAASHTANLTIDDQSISGGTAKTHVPSAGWHLVANQAKTELSAKLSDYGCYGFGASAASGPGGTTYGGFRLAEAIVSTNFFTDDERARILAYLRQKWFGGCAIARVTVAAGATLDTSEAPLKTSLYEAAPTAELVGAGLRFAGVLRSEAWAAATGTYAARDKVETVTPNLSFTGDACVSVVTGTGLVDRVRSSTGILRKTGDGVLEAAFTDSSVTALQVENGTLTIDPLVTPGAYVHVDSTRAETMTITEENGTNLVTQWRDVNGNGRYFTRSAESFAYGAKTKKRYPFLTTGIVAGKTLVDFGTFNDFAHTDGWGAEMSLNAAFKSPLSEDNPGIFNVQAVWGDREEAKNVATTNGLSFPGPVLFGSGGAWYRGYGGNGSAFPIRTNGESFMGDDNIADGEAIGYSVWMKSYIPSEPLFVQDSYFASADYADDHHPTLQELGGNATEKSRNDSGAVRGVCGGLRLGELLVFRYPIPQVDRLRVDAALNAKWFDRSNSCAYAAVSIAAGGTLRLPNTDLIAERLALAGRLEARRATVRRLDLGSAAVVTGPVTVGAGGVLALAGSAADGLSTLTATDLTFEGRGTIDLSRVTTTGLAGTAHRLFATSSGGGLAARAWRGRHETEDLVAELDVRDDGVYVVFSQKQGCVLIVR